jgi:hypothetical protein
MLYLSSFKTLKKLTMLPQETAGQDVLLNLDYSLVRAEQGKRFLNYIIDFILFYVILFVGGICLALISPSALEWLADDSALTWWADRLLTFVCYALYMFVVEAVFKGKSLGKLITGTRAVNLDGSRISVSTALARGFSRAVPLCAFSALGKPCNPWQDQWTDTMVIDERASHFMDPATG